MNLFNSLSQTVEKFVPLKPGEVSLYVCGITPYDTTHLGHAFVYTTFDTLRRILEHQKFKVNYTQNVTDIDDDILRKAKESGRDWQELGNFWVDRFLTDLKALNVLMPTNYVKATSSIPTMVKIAAQLIEEGIAYEKAGCVYFEVAKDPSFGKLSKFNSDQMKLLLQERGGNINDPNKKAPLDFLLWQKSGPDEPSWPSPWGQGRPGWHIECSAMIKDTLGDQIDIHGGGRDLVFPHHESEIAQSEAFTHKAPFVKYWLHCAMVMYQGEKMSKSLGNLILVSDLLKKYSPNAVRWLLLSHHYRTPWEYYEEELAEAQKLANQFKIPVNEENGGLPEEIITALDNDLNTPEALKIINQNPKKYLSTLKILGFT